MALDFDKTGVIPFYYFLAMVESYRYKKIGSDAVSSKPTPAPDAPGLTPLQDALIKLSAYVSTGNNGGAFLSREIFGMFDRNRDGTVSTNEFELAIDSFKLDITAR